MAVRRPVALPGLAGARTRTHALVYMFICVSCLFDLVRRSLYIPVQLTSLISRLNPRTCTHFFLARDSNPRPSLGRGTLSSRSCSGPCCLPFWTGLCCALGSLPVGGCPACHSSQPGLGLGQGGMHRPYHCRAGVHQFSPGSLAPPSWMSG